MPEGLLIKLQNLLAFVDQFPAAVVALSGGVDSMLLTYILHRYSSTQVSAIHAASPAVPESALERINQYKQAHNWRLTIIDAQELANPNYQNNPVNRCYFCKSSLYQRIQTHSSDVIFSGTNMDDLGDYRPGLAAADENHVRHPFVEANITKSEIYLLAESFGLTGLQSLPAQPCLASRIETGIKVTADDLVFIDATETLVRDILPEVSDIRCRITQKGVVIELAELPQEPELSNLIRQVTAACLSQRRVLTEVRKYQKGSAFLHPSNHLWNQIKIKQVS